MPRMSGLLAAFLTLGCQAPIPAEAPVQVQLQLRPYRVQALVSAPTAADVDHIKLAVYRDGVAVPGATRTVSSAAFSEPFALSHLRMGTAYEIRATAYADAAETRPLSDPALSRAAFSTPGLAVVSGVATIETAPIAVAVPVKLVDRVYSGQAEVEVTVERKSLHQVRVTLWRDGVLAYQAPPAMLTAAPATFSLTLTNLKPGVGEYRLQAEGLNRGGNVVVSTDMTFSTLPRDGAISDRLGPFPLAIK